MFDEALSSYLHYVYIRIAERVNLIGFPVEEIEF